ncbi:RsiV family protein [Butyrivibrio sp. AE2032]|uniref:RsiV family protein n=1 Tax=Butyrivibrio sp. AE2032 TaxID=1458463 RepID=UPI001639650A|nr:RsiV family protein [Butyrivibrio sp. AE2032]
MKKRVLLCIMATALLTGAIAGCGKKGDESSAESSVEASVEAGSDTSSEGASVSDATGDEAAKEVFQVFLHNLACEKDGKVEAIGSYPEILLTESYGNQYPKLQTEISSQNYDWSVNVKAYVNEYAGYEKMDFQQGVAFESDIGADIERADDRLFTLMVYFYDDAGGAHPSHSTGSINMDPATGKVVPLQDVLKDVDGAPQIFKDALYEAYPDAVDEFESMIYREADQDVTDAFRQKLMEDGFTWTLKSEGLRIYYSPYEVASYAAGEFETLLTFDKYPDLVQSVFIPDSDLDKEKMTDTRSLEKEVFQWEESDMNLYESDADTVDVITVPNKTWSAYTEDGRGPDDGEHIKLTKVSEKKTDWLDTYKWANENGFEQRNMPYYDSEYYYEGVNPVEYGYMNTGLLIHDRDYTKVLYNLDLSTLCNGPDEEKGRVSNSTQFIRWAKIYDGTLYVSIIINGYSSEEPNSSYMVAIQPDTGYVLWRSQPLVANANNFEIVKDTIICGYGFTAEPDYIYLLDRFTGQEMDKIPVNSAPDQFEVVGNELYVATYNTAYEFKIE